MNSTNRAVNRIFLLVIGAALLAVGLTAVAVSTLPGWEGVWRRTVPSLGDTVASGWTVGLAFAGLSRVPWLLLVVPAGAAIVIALLLLLLVFTQGHGRVGNVLAAAPTASETAEGTVTVDTAVAREILQRATGEIPGMSGMSVSAYRVKGRPAVKLTATARRGADPVAMLRQLERAVDHWDATLGQRVPVFVHVAAGGALARPARTVDVREPDMQESR